MGKKWIYRIALVMVVGFVLFFYWLFNVDPISNYVSKKKLETYIAQNYPTIPMEITSGKYRTFNGGYSFSTSVNGQKYEFDVFLFSDKPIYDEYKAAEVVDKERSDKLSQSISDELTNTIHSKIPDVKIVDVNISLDKGDFSMDGLSVKEVMQKQKPYVQTVINSTHETKEQFKDTVSKLKQLLDESGYVYSEVNVNGNNLDGDLEKEKMVLYATAFDSKTPAKEITLSPSKKEMQQSFQINKTIYTIIFLITGASAIYFILHRRKKQSRSLS